MGNQDTICFFVENNLSDFPHFNSDLNFNIFTKDQTLKFSVSLEDLEIYFLEIFKDLFKAGKKVITWNIKDFFSLVLHKTKKKFVVESNFFDLKIIEKFIFFDFNDKAPDSYNSCLNRLKNCVNSKNWKQYMSLHTEYYKPLISNVIPAIENVGVLSHQLGRKIYPYYVIDGENNGRMGSSGHKGSTFNPHNLGPEQRQDLMPNQREDVFINIDFKNQEVVVLAWLSKDQKLVDFLSKNDDFYANVYELLFNKKYSDTSERSVCKKAFLPTFYGMSAFNLSQSIGVSLEEAEQVQNNIRNQFRTAWDWIVAQQESVKNHKTYYDHFGRCRIFKENEEYKVRNFAVQSPAAVICNKKLMLLHDNIKEIPYFVRDGYYFYSKNNKIKENLLKFYKNLVQFEENMRFKVSIKFGRDLDNLKSIK